ncbi:MAG: DUF2085 domain-containing protein [Candidatus Dojkabacteria bacterium]|nr:DUF2085 domain-containing protein [Candidatus Dojkabacteria bacterium]MDQ7020312.1 DUF2085 domain-containing protein [Candidatus Dojkabacteria bacterium]
MKKINIFDYYIIFLTILFALPLLAPIFSHFGLDGVAKPIYFFYSFFCHQFHTRSLHLFDNQYAWCARDTGIWFGWLLAAISIRLSVLNNIKFKYYFLLLIPIVIDGGIQTFGTLQNIGTNGDLSSTSFYISNNLMRFITGGLFGFGIGSMFAFYIKASTEKNIEGDKNERSNKSSFKNLASLLSILLITYIFLIQAWSISSHEYKPTNFLDSKTKIQETDFLQRRTNGVCPVAGEDMFKFECFF